MHSIKSHILRLVPLFATFTVCQAGNTPQVDLTKSIVEDTSHTYHLGPTGARGWIQIHAFRATPDDYEQYFCTDQARQILITQVAEGSPADGILAPGDVILGIGDRPFENDARRTFAHAIDEAEREENQGKLHLLRWRPDRPDEVGATTRPTGSSETVTLTLRVMGAFSDTAPSDCPKSAIIIADAKRRIIERGLGDRIHIGALGLLATGDEDAIAVVREFIETSGVASPDLNVKNPHNMVTWNWAYSAILLGEYHQITGDKSVLPALEEYAVHLAKGQAICGGWGHGVANLDANDGIPNARLAGYGTLNHPSLAGLLALVIAEHCGIDRPEIKQGIQRAGDTFGYFAGKGSMPYGNGQPLEYLLANGGMSGLAAIAFAIHGQQDRAKFFAAMSAAAHDRIDVGHTGSYFGLFLTPLGANVAGPETTAEFFKQHRWMQTLARRWDGGFVYQPPGGRWGGSREHYNNMSSDGAFLVFYASPRRNLLMTGRDADRSLWLEGHAAAEAIHAGLLDYDSINDARLVELLGHQIPMVRRKAADALGTRGPGPLPEILNLLENGPPEARIGAIHAIGAIGEKATSAAPAVVAVIEDATADPWLRSRALVTLRALGKPDRATLEGLLRVVLEEKPADPRLDIDIELANTLRHLIEDPYESELDFDLFHAAIHKLLGHPHHYGRTPAMSLIRDIPIEHLHAVADRIVEVIRNDNPNYETYHSDAARAAGLNIFERHHIRDGIDLAMATLETDLWGKFRRIYSPHGRLAFLAKYGTEAHPLLPQLNAMRESNELGSGADPFITAIAEADHTRELITLEQAIQTGRTVIE